jgi:hypothetical protein
MKINFGSKTFPNLNLNPSTTLLDIDLDFFSTNNPTYNGLQLYFGHSNIQNIVKIFNPENYCLEKMKNVSVHVKKYLLTTPIPTSKIDNGKSSTEAYISNLIHQDALIPCTKMKSDRKFEKCTHLVRKLWCKGESDAKKFLKLFRSRSKMYLEMPDDFEGVMEDITISAYQVHNLPLHVYTPSKIRNLKNQLIQYLKENGLTSSPKMISIAESEADGHTPKHLINFLRFEVYDLLNTMFVNSKE